MISLVIAYAAALVAVSLARQIRRLRWPAGPRAVVAGELLDHLWAFLLEPWHAVRRLWFRSCAIIRTIKRL